MQTKTKEADTRDRELDEELAGILSAISVVSKRLAKKLLTLQHQGGRKGEGGRQMGKTGDWSEAVTELKMQPKPFLMQPIYLLTF